MNFKTAVLDHVDEWAIRTFEEKIKNNIFWKLNLEIVCFHLDLHQLTVVIEINMVAFFLEEAKYLCVLLIAEFIFRKKDFGGNYRRISIMIMEIDKWTRRMTEIYLWKVIIEYRIDPLDIVLYPIRIVISELWINDL